MGTGAGARGEAGLIAMGDLMVAFSPSFPRKNLHQFLPEASLPVWFRFNAGGNGGRGGDVVLESSASVWDLSNLQHHLVRSPVVGISRIVACPDMFFDQRRVGGGEIDSPSSFELTRLGLQLSECEERREWNLEEQDRNPRSRQGARNPPILAYF